MEQIIDVEKRHLSRLRELLSIHLTDKTVWAYGSRVKWKADKVSDLDLVVMDAEYSQVVNARDAFSESNLPFTVQLLSWEGIPDNFKENIRKKYVVLQEGNGIPEGWREVKLGEICEIIGGGTPRTNVPEYWDGDISWITPKDLSNVSNRYISRGSRSISQLGLESSSAKLLPEGAVLLSTRAPVGYLAIADNEVCTNQGFRSLVVNEDTSNTFVYYLLKRNVEYLKSQSAGTTFGELAGYTLKNLSFLLPPLPEQEAIAEILSSLDDKIDLLRRQNETLETMAQTLFRQWFVEEARDDWEMKALGDFLDFLEGPGIRNWQYTESGIRFINIRLIQNGEIDIEKSNFVSKEEANGRYKHFLLQEKDMIVSTSGTLGKTAVIRDCHLPLMLNTSVIRFRPKDGLNYSFMYQYLQSRLFEAELGALGDGSVQKNFGPTHLRMIRIKIPPKQVLERFRKQADGLYLQLSKNHAIIQTMKNLRDTILPKLMKGEVRLHHGE